jgi:hypothetical protein
MPHKKLSRNAPWPKAAGVQGTSFVLVRCGRGQIPGNCDGLVGINKRASVGSGPPPGVDVALWWATCSRVFYNRLQPLAGLYRGKWEGQKRKNPGEPGVFEP